MRWIPRIIINAAAAAVLIPASVLAATRTPLKPVHWSGAVLADVSWTGRDDGWISPPSPWRENLEPIQKVFRENQIDLAGYVFDPDEQSSGWITTSFAPTRLTFRKIIDVTSGPPSTAIPSPGTPTTIEDVRTKLGADLLTRAEALTALTDPADAVMSVFANLTPTEVSVLPAAVKFNGSQITCATLAARPSASLVDGEQIVSCEGDSTKYLLDFTTTGQAR